MPSAADVLRAAAERLAAVSDTPRLDAEILLAHALGVSRARLLARLRDPLDAPEYETLVVRRLDSEPIAYILGHWEFYSLDFLTRAPILVPRPETEHLVDVALEFIADRPLRVLDLCTGTGCVAAAIAKNAPGCAVVATDRNPDAAALARENAARLRIPLMVHEGDLFNALPPEEPPFDCITANPPYVESGAWEDLSPVIRRHEDPRALLAGEDGLDCIRSIVAQAPHHLVPGGMLALEVGENQAASVLELMARAGFRNTRIRHDLAGIPRITFASLP